MGKVEIGIYCYLTADGLKVLLTAPWVFLHQPYEFSPNCWIWLVDGNQKAKFANNHSKIISSEAIKGIKLKLCRNVHNVSLFTFFFFFFFFFFFVVVVVVFSLFLFVFLFFVFCFCFVFVVLFFFFFFFFFLPLLMCFHRYGNLKFV